MNTLTQFFGVASIGTLIYFYYTNNVVRYYVRHTFFAIAMTTCATIYIPLMLFRWRDYRNGLLPSWTLTMVGRAMGLRCTIEGKENIVQDSACIMLMNHQSVVDMLVLAYLWPNVDRCSVIAKKEIFYMWPFGLATWLWGTIFIDRLNGEKAKDTINKTAKTINDRKAKLCMFPEGTRHGGDDLLPFKKGAFFVAISSQCPVQPIIVSRYYFLNSKKHIFDGGHINVKILPAIPTAGLKKENIETLMSTTYNVMNQQYKVVTENMLKSVKYNKCE